MNLLSSYRPKLLMAGAALVLGAILSLAFYPVWTHAATPDPVTAAWERARAAGSYEFTSDITQVTLPLATLSNVGHTGRTDKLYLEGQNDLRASQMEFTLWSEGGNVLQAESGLSVRTEGGKTFARRGAGEWEEIDEVTGAVAPQGDFLSYLAAIKAVQAQPSEARGGISFTRYTFQIDSPQFAAYMHKQMEAALRARGELPPSLHLDVPVYFRDMVGSGELWVGDDGLPLRQILTLQFPAQNDEQVHTQIVVDFSQFGREPTVNSEQSSVISRWLGTGDWSRVTDGLTPFLIILPLLAGAVLLLTYRRVRLVQAAVAILVIFAQVAGPVLTTYTNVQFFDAQTAKAAAQQERLAAADEEREVREALGTVEFNPHLNPLESVTSDQSAATGDSWESAAQSPALQTVDTGLDTDGDTLTDFAEERIGTSTVISDTDGDGLNDNVEVNGFDFGGQRWYTDPALTDSNGDGQGDALEWGLDDNGLRTTPLDTDGDGFPDLFDTDNDDDSVPDSKDLSLFAKGAVAYLDTDPLLLQIKNLTPGTPTFVEFQLRPQETSQLWYAFNVLDWPQDSAGQVRDVDGQTYANVATSSGSTPAASEANGDMKVVPMLEIRIPITSANLPPQSDLTPFNISVNDFAPDGKTKIAYIPLNVVTDEKSGQRVAFSAQMRYLPTGAWLDPHEVRLAWLVQALVDLPCDKTTDPSADCQADGLRNNVPQVIQSYYSPWNLTGLSVREEHGADLAAIYEDPAVDTNKKDDAALWALSFVLDHHLVVGRDENNDGQRDLKVSDLAARFDRDNHPSEAQRFAVPDILQVEAQRYPTLDQALATTTMTTTKQILNKFTSAVTSDPTIKPLLFFAQESRSRTLGLDLSIAGGGYVSQNGKALALDMAPPNQPAQQVAVLAGLKWMGYCPTGAPITWRTCADEEYWTELEQRYAALPPEPGETDGELVSGRLQLAQFYYSGFSAGYVATVQDGPAVISSRYSLVSESGTETKVRAITQGLAAVPRLASEAYSRAGYIYEVLGPNDNIDKWAAKVRNKIANARLESRFEGFSQAERAKSKREYRQLKLEFNRFKLGRIGAVGAMLMVIGQVVSYFPDLPPVGRAVLSGFTIALSIGVTVVIPALELALVLKTASATLRTAMRITSTVPLSIQKGGVVGLVVAAAVTWGFFIYGAVANGYTLGSPQLNRAFFEAVASTIVTIVMFVLALNPVGAIVAAVLGVIDLIFSLTCELGVSELRNVPGLDGACFSITTLITKYLAKLLYSYDLMVNLERSDLVITDQPQVTLADPAKGYVAGNSVSVVLPVTTTIMHKNPDPNNGVLIYPYMYLFSEANLKRSSFQYSLTKLDGVTAPAALDQMPSLWQHVRERNAAEGGKYLVSPMYRADMRTVPAALTGQPLAVGLNTPVPMTLNMSYAIPAYECWILAVIPICYNREFKGDNHLPINSLQYDVFPPTLGEFFALTGKADGGLGQSWDAQFPSLRDADGDALLSFAHNGLDPNDAAPDADGDGLTDRYELDQQAAGVALSPILRDTDNDGLTDPQEIRLGTDPAVADSDNDGLNDGEEVRHLKIHPDTGLLTTAWEGGWRVEINAATPFSVWVSSDPLNADGDTDGLPDQTERQLAQDANPANRVDSQNQPYHPAVPNSPPLALVLETSDLDGFLAPGQRLQYTNTVIANTAVVSGVLNVNPPSILGGARKPLALGFNPLTFTATQTVTLPISLTVAPGIGTQPTRLSSTVNTRLQDTGVATWSFAPLVTEAPLGGIVAPTVPYFTDLTASRPDRQDNFLLSALATQSSGSIGFGDILGYSIPGGAMGAIENDANNTTAILGQYPHQLATNTGGDTLAVWRQQRYCNTITLNSLRVVTAGADAQDATAGIEPIIGFDPAAGSESIVWRWDQNGGTPMTGGQQRGPNAFGFPLTLDYCGGLLTLNVYDNDGATNQLVEFETVDLYFPRNGVALTFTGAGHTIELNVTVPVRDADVIAASLVGSDGQVKRSVPVPTSPVPTTYERQNFGPAVASDGSGFLVAYESFAENTSNGSYGLPQIVVQTFDKDGNPLNQAYRDAGSTQAGTPGAESLAIAVAWTGASYRVIWQDRRASALYWATATADGQSLSAPQLVTTSGLVNSAPTEMPGIAYDPVSGRTLILYLSSTRGILGRVYAGDTLVAGPKVISLAQFPAARSPRVVWHPNYQGWLLSYQDNASLQRHVFVPLNANGDLAFAPTTGFFIEANDNSLACPAPQSVPAVDLRFEESPGATSFVDASGRGNNGLCTGAACPTAGFAGAPNAPISDYAVQFDGVDDSLTLNRTVQDDFSVAFWLKAPTANGQRMLVDGGDFNTTGFHILLNNGGVLVRTPGIGFQTTRIDDNQWHFVAVTRHKASGRVDIYVDGALRVGLNGSPDVTLNGVADLRIGLRRNNTQPLLATLDNLQIIPATLGPDTVQALYNRSLQSYCVAAGPRDSNVYWAKVQASQSDVRGGRLTASNGLTLTIDSDLPTAQITAVQNNEIVGPGLVIGGTASDATSGVDLVEVSINNGPWTAAQGANSWAFSLAGQNGAISLRVRAMDRVGNIGNPSAPINLTVDSVAPAVTVNAPAGTIKPTKNANSRWQVNLTGTASDASGIKPDSVLVRLTQQSGVGMPQTEQPATLTGTTWNLNYLLDASLYDPTGAYTVTVQARDVVGNAGTPATAILRLDASGPTAVLSNADATRTVISQTLTIGGVVSDTVSIAGIDKLEIAFTPVEQIATLPAGLTGEQAEARLNRTWTPVTLTGRGAGVATTTWRYQLPTGLENLYQIDLRGTDMLGNVAISANLWRGTIDTADPRLVMTAKSTGASYFDAASKQRRYAIRFLCAAVDRNLAEASFACPGKGVAEPTRSFATIPELQTLFPDLTIRNGLAISYTLWLPATAPAATTRACDRFGRCAQANTGQMTDVIATPAANEPGVPLAVIVAPADGSFVADDDTLNVTVAAEAAAALKTVTIRLDNTVVQTLDFAQSETVTSTQRTLSIPITNEGQHTLVAQAIDWANGTQTTLYPVTFMLDKAAPTVTIDTNTLTVSDTWQLQSGILRFNGTANDSVGLATVQVREQHGAFVDATVEGGNWRTALAVQDPEGRTLTIIVRAIDRAGRVTEITQQIATALSAANAPDTTISSGPVDSTNATSATLVFAGTASTVIFDCQLDDGPYTTCASPTTYSNLSKGSHTFRVRAIDSRGFVDLTPASHTWTVGAGAVDATISSGPGNPTTERTASFVFTGNGATSFECSLDGAAFVPCVSPQNYSGLGYGDHSFAVRGRNGNTVGAAASYPWTINNTAPVAVDQTLTTTQGIAIAITLSASDADTVTYKLIDPPAHGVLLGTPPALTYTPDSGFTGEDRFTFVANDGLVDSNVATVRLLVTPTGGENQPPTAGNDAASTVQNTAVLINVLVNDADPEGDPLTITSATTPANGTAIVEGNQVRYTPNTGFVGRDSFAYTIADGQGGASTATVTVTVTEQPAGGTGALYLPLIQR
jgi:hypothetical protein